MIDKHRERIDEFIRACHRVGEYGLLRYSSGNMSCRLDDELVAVTARRAWLGEITPEGVAICTLADGRSVNDVELTAESGFHLGILRSRRDVDVVLHFQSPFATAIACGREIDYNFNVIPELPIYIGEPAVVRYLQAGSKELADETVAAMQNHDLAILQNHGQVVVGKGFDDTIQKAGFFELACQILLLQNKPRFIQ
jgi:ribulose-5-phosphate 4-epimerase/fuculose-1-phosphate aldolase